MNDDQITALAREYAEETSAYEYLKDNPKSTSAKKILDITVRDASAVLRWLSTRFCLVEKKKVIEAYKAELLNKRVDDYCGVKDDTDAARLELLHSLFPEIAKEVEG